MEGGNSLPGGWNSIAKIWRLVGQNKASEGKGESGG